MQSPIPPRVASQSAQHARYRDVASTYTNAAAVLGSVMWQVRILLLLLVYVLADAAAAAVVDYASYSLFYHVWSYHTHEEVDIRAYRSSYYNNSGVVDAAVRISVSALQRHPVLL